MQVCKIYCLENKSVIDVPYTYSLYGYISHSYTNHPDNDSYEAKNFIDKTGTFMAIYPDGNAQFIVSKKQYRKYMIDSEGALSITDFETHNGEVDYVDIVKLKYIYPTMCALASADADYVFIIMDSLRHELCSIVDQFNEIASGTNIKDLTEDLNEKTKELKELTRKYESLVNVFAQQL